MDEKTQYITISKVQIACMDEKESLPLARKIFTDNQHLLNGKHPFKSNFKNQNVNKHIIDERYACLEDVEKLKETILVGAIKFLKEMGFYMDMYEYDVRNFWINEMWFGATQDTHNHVGYIVSGTYYVDNPTEIVFTNPAKHVLFSHMQDPNRKYVATNSENWTLLPQEGDMLFWFSGIEHSVAPVNLPPDLVRRAIPFDVTISGLK